MNNKETHDKLSEYLYSPNPSKQIDIGALENAIVMLERVERVMEVLAEEVKENEEASPFSSPCGLERDILEYFKTGEGL